MAKRNLLKERDDRVKSKIESLVGEVEVLSKSIGLDGNAIVTRRIPRLDSNIVKESKPGRKKRFTPTKMKNGINDYFKWCEDNDEIPSLKGLMIHLKMYKDQFYTYLGYPEFKNMMEHARLIISNWIETDIYNSPGMAAGKIKYAQNVLDWADKSETISTVTQKVITVDEARAKIEMLAPKLLDMLKNKSLVNQLSTGEVVEAEVIRDVKTDKPDMRRVK